MSKTTWQKKNDFVKEYLKDFNPTRAARDVGCINPREDGIKFLSDEYVSKKIKSAISKIVVRNESNKEAVLHKMLRIANADLGEFYNLDAVEWEDFGGQKHSNDILRLKPKDETDTFLIKKISYGKYGPQIELHSKEWALEMLSKYFGLTPNKIDLDGELKIKTSFTDLVKQISEA